MQLATTVPQPPSVPPELELLAMRMIPELDEVDAPPAPPPTPVLVLVLVLVELDANVDAPVPFVPVLRVGELHDAIPATTIVGERISQPTDRRAIPHFIIPSSPLVSTAATTKPHAPRAPRSRCRSTVLPNRAVDSR
jgi:hypothetical protein